MEYGQREPMKSVSAKEPTAFTMKSIKELIAEEKDTFARAVTLRMAMPKSELQQPPHLRGAAPAPRKPAVAKPVLKASSAPQFEAEITSPPTAIPASIRGQIDETPEPTAKSRSFFSRLIGG